MRQKLITATDRAIRAVDAIRFYQTERGFHGRFYCALHAELDRAELIGNGAILEMEYQKSSRHGIGQRPDIVFHVPSEHSGASITANNFAVWALKRQATASDARDDFDKLDQMFRELEYPLGFFVNIDAEDPMYSHYLGAYGARLLTVSAQLSGTQVAIQWASGTADVATHP